MKYYIYATKGAIIMANKKYKVLDEYDWSVFRSNLQQLMDSYGFLQRDFARELNLSTTSISRYLSGLSTPDLVSVWRIADYFDVTIDWLLGRMPSRFDSIPDKQREVLNKYSAANPSDRLVIDTILQKYNDK